MFIRFLNFIYLGITFIHSAQMQNFTWDVTQEVKEVSQALFIGGGRIYGGHSSSGLVMENVLCLLP